MNWRSLYLSLGSRVVVLSLTGIFTLLATRVVIQNFGVNSYAAYGLLVGLPGLLPFIDLGVGTAVVNVISKSDDATVDPGVVGTLLSAIRVILASVILVLIAVAIIGYTDSWQKILGAGLQIQQSGLVLSFCGVLFCASVLASIGHRILLGLSKNHLSVICVGVQAPLLLFLVFLLSRIDPAFGGGPALCFFVAQLFSSLLSLYISSRMIGPALGAAIRAVFSRSVRGYPVMDAGGPMMVTLIVVPIGLQVDRIVLSHVRGPQDLLQYTLAAQVFLPMQSLVASAGIALWPIYAKARQSGSTVNPVRVAAIMGGCVSILCLVVVGVQGPLFALLSAGEVNVNRFVVVAFSAFLVVQAINQGLGYYLFDVPGLRFQAICGAVMAAANLPLSVILGKEWGASGPLVASTMSIGFLQVVPYYCRVRKLCADTNRAL